MSYCQSSYSISALLVKWLIMCTECQQSSRCPGGKKALGSINTQLLESSFKMEGRVAQKYNLNIFLSLLLGLPQTQRQRNDIL